MWDVFRKFIGRAQESGTPIRISMSETFGSIDFKVNGETYLLTIMKEEKKDDSV